MDFGDILEKWEKQRADPGGIYDKDAAALWDKSGEKNTAGDRRYRLLRKKPEASIDLHGLNREEAWTALETFFENSRRNGFEKVLIIHGKGNHRNYTLTNTLLDDSSWNEGVLRDLARHFIESCSFAGESGQCTAREGGTGATWVILKETSF